MKTLVLIVEDDPYAIERHEEVLEQHGLTHVSAQTVEDARRLFAMHCDELAGIILDANLGGDGFDTQPFLEEVTKTNFIAGGGIVMAASGSPGYRKVMMEQGCTHLTTKGEAAADLVEHLAGG